MASYFNTNHIKMSIHCSLFTHHVILGSRKDLFSTLVIVVLVYQTESFEPIHHKHCENTSHVFILLSHRHIVSLLLCLGQRDFSVNK